MIIAFSGLCCKSNANNSGDENEVVSTKDTSNGTKAFESEAKALESADRVIWQKPDLVIDQLGKVEGKVVADLGAGTGYFSRRIAYKGAKVIAIDIDPRAVQWMEAQKARFPVELQERLIIRQADPDNPHLNPDEVDIILLVNTYAYISNRVPYFTKLKDAITHNGNVIIIDFKKKETPFGPPIEERMDISDVVRELREAGYSILKIDEESLDYQYIIKAKSD
ncbi:MAG TPA: methyltransferase domain-containing protein [Saprospiraceae bacterium]|nr:methyltransferase domain-containing protein [Saprospiraceae bacterium]